ncbi:MAG TPA: hypothetical protein VIV40_20745 [Kofleriaceae bacterium]
MSVRGVALLLLLWSAQAFAQSSPADAEFKRGKALMAQNKFAEACAAFDKSQELEASVSVMLNQANCREKNGQLATARKLFVAAAAQTDRATDAKNVQFHNVGLDRAAKLGDRVSTLTIDVPTAARVMGLSIKRDGDAIDQLAWGTALQLDGGTYTVEASAPDRKPWSATVTLGKEKDRKTVTVPVLELVVKPDVTSPDTTKPDTTKPDTTKPDTTKPDVTTKPDTTSDLGGPIEPAPHRSRVVPILVGVGGIALLATAAGFEAWASTTYEKAQKEGNDNKQTDLWHSANKRRYIAEGAGIVGVATIGVAVWLYIRAGRPSSKERVTLQPAAGQGRAALVLSGSF